MKLLKLIFIFLAYFLLFPVYAAHDTLLLFNYQKCIRWTIDNEPRNGWGGEEERIYKIWAEKAESMKDERWSVYVTNNDLRVGICGATSTKYGSEFSCLMESHNNFPLAGISYIYAKNGKLSSVKCAGGCKKTVLYEIISEPYEGENDDPSIQVIEKAFKRFERMCPGRG